MNDPRIQRYLADQAAAIDLAPADVTAVTKRGNRRRNQKRGGVLAAVAVLGVLGTSLVLTDDDPQQSVESQFASAVVPTDLDWTVVQAAADRGLAYGAAVSLEDGTLYALSTAPGPSKANSLYTEQRLYRSTDGTEWEEADLPNGIKLSTLYGAGDTLYAVGTAPAGGDARKLSLASTDDGGATWNELELPDDVSRLEQQFPGMISISQPSVAAQDATHQVATVVVSTVLTPSLYRDDIPEDGGWEQTPDGLKVYKPLPPCSEAGMPVSANPTDEEAEEYRAAMQADGACRAEDKEPEVLGVYTWDELGMPAELRQYIGGKAFTYATEDGQSFQRVELPGDVRGWGASVLAAPDGYRLFLSENTITSATTTVLRSEDGLTWTPGGSFGGSFSSAGMLGDRPAVAVWPFDGPGEVRVELADGTWSVIDVLSAIDVPAGHDAWLSEAAFGPLGLAATVNSFPRDGETGQQAYLVHSKDGTTLSVLDLADHFGNQTGYTIGLAVNADAITVRAVHGADGDAATVEPTDVLVGTPR
ncbi:MAG: glycoside hydrolase [Actinomycetota bacterium]|nr:glycoside hydrolase [Actinomycetota bacterium]